MKRRADDVLKKGESVEASDELSVPSNCTVRRCCFNAASLSEVELADADLVTNVITYCALEIAQKHQRVVVSIAVYKETFQGYKLVKYTVQLEMPKDVPLPNSHQTNALHCLSTNLIVDPIVCSLNADKPGYVLEVPIYSHKNPWRIAYKSITHVCIKELLLVTQQQPVESAPSKRARTESRRT